MKDTTDNMRCILWLLTGQERLTDFIPIRITGKGHEEIWFPEMPTDGHCILILLSHMSRTTDESGRKDNLFTQTLCIILHTASDCILKATITICTQFHLILHLKSQPVSFNTYPCINYHLLK